MRHRNGTPQIEEEGNQMRCLISSRPQIEYDVAGINNSTGEGMAREDSYQKILSALDIDFSDGFEGENVRELTLLQKTDLLEKSVTIVQIEESMNFSVFSSLGSDHPSAEIYAMDFPSDLRASIYVLLGGYYRQAILCLRNWMEMRLLGVYFGHTRPYGDEYKAWKAGTAEGPFGRTLIGRLFSRVEFRRFEEKLNLRSSLETLYSELSVFTHGGALERHNLQSETDNVPRFNQKSVELWYLFAQRVFADLVLCFAIAYGKQAFSSLEPSEKAMLKHLLPAEYTNELARESVL